MQVWAPVAVLGQVVREMFGQKNMSGVAAIHDALGYVNTRTSDIQHVVYIGNAIDRSAMNSHSNVYIGITLQRLAQFQRASRGLFRAAKEKERHSIASRQPDQLTGSFRCPKGLRAAHQLI